MTRPQCAVQVCLLRGTFPALRLWGPVALPANRNGGRHQRFGGFTNAARNDLGADRIGANQTDWSVLLGRPNWYDDYAARSQISLDLDLALQLQLHCLP